MLKFILRFMKISNMEAATNLKICIGRFFCANSDRKMSKNLFLSFLLFNLFVIQGCVSKITDKSNGAVFFMKLFSGDYTSPKISFTSPSSIDTDFELNRKFAIVFNEKIQSGVEKPIQVKTGPDEVPGVWEIADNCLLFTPSSELKSDSEFTVIVYGLEDLSSNKMEGVYQFQFKTGSSRAITPIQINAIYPENDSNNVELNKQIAVEFNEVFYRPGSESLFELKLGQEIVPFDFIYSGNIATIKPKSEFAASSSYTFTVKSDIQNMAGIKMGTDFVINFLTTTKADTTPPEIDSHFPLAVNEPISLSSKETSKIVDSRKQQKQGDLIGPSQFLMVNFTEVVDSRIAMNQNVLVLEKNTGTNVEIGIRYGLSSFTVYPKDRNWKENTEFVLQVKSLNRDVGGVNMKEDFELFFQTGGFPPPESPPPPPPQMTTSSPTNNSVSVPLRVRVKIVFDKPVFRPSVNVLSVIVKEPSGENIPGKFQFENNFTIVFIPDNVLKPKTKYTGNIKTSVKGMGNDKLNSEYTFSFTTEELVAPANLSYGGSFFSLYRSVSIPPMSPSYSGIISSCSVSPPLPEGLLILKNCTIYGNPTKSQPSQVYTITASNLGGSTETKMSLAVGEVGFQPFYIGYSDIEYKFTKDQAISTINPISVGTIQSCSILPPLPSGLSINQYCMISGTPTELRSVSTYTVTAKGFLGETTAKLDLSVSNPIPIANTVTTTSTSTVTTTSTTTTTNESNALTVNLSTTNTSIWEGVGSVSVVISLSKSPTSIVGVDYTTVNGTATAGADFTATSGTLYFRSGETSKTVNISITNDTDYEVSETFKFKLSQTLGDSSVLGVSELTFTINDANLSEGLVYNLPFSGNAIESISGQAADLFGTGGAQNLPQLIPDRKGNPSSAYNLDGTDDYMVTKPNVGITGTSHRTLSFWMKFPVTNANIFQHPVCWGTPTLNFVFGMGIKTDNTIWFTGHGNDFGTTQTIHTDWAHWVITYDSVNVAFYKNGIFITQSARTLNTADSGLVIGRRVDGAAGYYMNGSIDDIKIYNRSMDADEVRSLYESEK